MDATPTLNRGQSLEPITSILADELKTLYNIEQDPHVEQDINQYINPDWYQNTKPIEKKDLFDTINIHVEKKSSVEDLTFFSSYPNPYTQLKGRFEVIQQWEGHIEEMDDALKIFQARLVDITIGGTDEYSEFSYDDVNEDDYDLMKVGAIFYYTMGKVKLNNGQIKKDLFLKFKRFPRMTQSDLDRAKIQADDIYRRFMERRNSQ